MLIKGKISGVGTAIEKKEDTANVLQLLETNKTESGVNVRAYYPNVITVGGANNSEVAEGIDLEFSTLVSLKGGDYIKLEIVETELFSISPYVYVQLNYKSTQSSDENNRVKLALVDEENRVSIVKIPLDFPKDGVITQMIVGIKSMKTEEGSVLPPIYDMFGISVTKISLEQPLANEITVDDIAILRNYIFGWEYGVLNIEGCNFNAKLDESGSAVILEKGIMFAYGYFGYLPESITIPFIKPSATQYRFIYAEIDRSTIPNTFIIKVKNNQGSDKIKPTTFRQDYLTAIRTGVFELPLWRVELNEMGIVKLVNVRDLIDYIRTVKHSDSTTGKVLKKIGATATGTNQPITDRSRNLATTWFVHEAVRNYIDNN